MLVYGTVSEHCLHSYSTRGVADPSIDQTAGLWAEVQEVSVVLIGMRGRRSLETLYIWPSQAMRGGKPHIEGHSKALEGENAVVEVHRGGLP